MTRTKHSKIAYSVHIAAKGSCLCFLFGISALVLALVLRLLAVTVVAMMCLALGCMLGGLSLLGASNARLRDISAGSVATLLNAFLFFVLYYNLFGPCQTSSPRSACLANLKQMEAAKRFWALENHKTTNDIPADTDLFGKNSYIRAKPQCPEGGTYRLGTVGQQTACSVPGHIFSY